MTVPAGRASWSPGVAGSGSGISGISPAGSCVKSMPPFCATRIEPSAASAAPFAPPCVCANISARPSFGHTRYSAPAATLVTTSVPSSHHTGPSENGIPLATTTSDFMREILPARVESSLVRIRVINQMGAAVAEQLQRARPDVDVIEFTGGDPPAGLAADVFFGGYFAWDEITRWIDAARVRWVQFAGTGVD